MSEIGTKNNTGLRLLLPWPDRSLNPNDRFFKKADRDAAENRGRVAGWYIAKERGVALDPSRRYKAHLILCPLDYRKYSIQRVLESLAPTLEGVYMYLKVDKEQVEVEAELGPVVEFGKVEFSIEEVQDDEA